MIVKPLRVKSVFLVCLFVTFLLFFKYRWHTQAIGRAKTHWHVLNHALGRPQVDFQAQLNFWRSLEFLLTSNGPGIPRPQQNGSANAVSFNATRPFEYPEMIDMSDDEVDKMRSAHRNYLKAQRVHAPPLVYRRGTRGIVVTAGGSYLPLVVITLRLLRRRGSALPMEVFLESGEEYESHICGVVLPRLNARCVILAEVLAAAPHPVQIAHFQLKIFAILLSSFEAVLFLDADSWPARDPAPLFAAPPFATHGLVAWPDFWYATPSKHFAAVSGVRRDDARRRAASEAGQLLVDKRSHARTLLVAAYYNYYGPEHYYPLLAQGGPGEGDKETFVAAARAAREPFYAVDEPVVAIGHARGPTNDPRIKPSIAGSAMVQFDPADDAARRAPDQRRAADPETASRPRPFFLHANFPKFNPGRVYDDYGLLHWDNGTLRRAWTDPADVMALFGRDVEREYWEEARWAACALEDKVRDWYESEGVCRKATAYLKGLAALEGWEPDLRL